MKDKKLLLIVLVMVLFVSIGKETYALFTNEVSSIVQSYSTGTLQLNYSNTSINLDNAYPLRDSDGMNQDENTITITNIGTLAYKFNVIIVPSSDSTISSDLIRVSMDGERPATLSSDGNIIIRDVILNPGSSRTFTIKLWISGNASSSDVLNKIFFASLTSTGIAVKDMEDSDGTVLIGPNKLYNQIENNADTTTKIDFSKTSEASNTNGIYMTNDTDSGKYVYYYRGNVDNYVLFANYCWRIVRTTETGGVKLIYNGVQKDVYETTIPIEKSSYTNITNDATYPYTFDSTTKTWISTNKTNSATGTISFSVATAGDYVLSYTVSSEAGYDKAIFYKNGTKLEEHSGTETGTISLIGLTTSDVIKIEYEKDDGDSSGNDTVTFSISKTVGNPIKSCNNIGSNTTIDNSAYNENAKDAKYFGYMYGSSIDDTANTTDSTIKATIDTWYKNNMEDYTSLLEDPVFCNDRSYTKNGSHLFFEARTRLGTNKAPSLKCQNGRDKFTTSTSNGNGSLTYPVSLITADEIAYAGGVQDISNSSFYLYTGQYYWTLSPRAFNGDEMYAYEFILDSEGSLSGLYRVYDPFGVRPVISLKPDTVISDGSGTATDPYIIYSQTSLYNEIKRKADTTTQIDFSKTSEESNTNGIYMTNDTDSGNPVYYYRGNVDNHLIFANFCWRIVRTTETGGVKLIYDGVPTNGECNNTGDTTTIGNSAFNSSSSSPADVGYMSGVRYIYKQQTMSSLSGSIVFGNDITYTNGTYTLKDTYTLTDVSKWSSERSTIASKYHYTCFTSNNTCTKVNYIHYIDSSTSYYFELSNGKNHLSILKEMLDNSTNENDSTIKKTVDTWYKNNMTDYTSRLEDTVFCNDRSYDISKTAWNKDYSNIGNYLFFNSYYRVWSGSQPTLVCSNTNDKFTVKASNGNGALTYPVGLLTVDEIMYAGEKTDASNSSFYLYNNQVVWTLSPFRFNYSYAVGFSLYPSGDLDDPYVSSSHSVRPVISLKQGTVLSSGSGTATDPFIVD